MTTLPVDVLLLILDCVYLDQSPIERQRTLAAIALTASRTLNALATPLLYATPHLSTKRSAQTYSRLFSYHASPFGVAGGRARLPKTHHSDREGTPLRQRIERFELVDVCGGDAAVSWIFWMYQHQDVLELQGGWEERWEDEESCQWLSDTHGIDLFDGLGDPDPGAEGAILKKMTHNFVVWEAFCCASYDAVTDAQRWTDPFSTTLAFSNLRRLSIPAFHEFDLIPTFLGRGHFPNLKSLAFNRNPQTGEEDLEVTRLDLLTMRRSVTR
ncbi:hypothetical protein RQP46_002429 [Phenoliferia psychrophenolica]